MGVIGTALSMSLDGFIAGQAGGAGGLHDWLTAGDIPSRFSPGLLDELIISLVPKILGRGVRLLDGLDAGSVGLEVVRVIDAPGVTHLTYSVIR
jgi:dihydrofolate reductase